MSRPVFNLIVIGLTAFLTVVDLFAAKAIPPALATAYNVTVSAMSVAANANANAFGMAAPRAK